MHSGLASSAVRNGQVVRPRIGAMEYLPRMSRAMKPVLIFRFCSILRMVRRFLRAHVASGVRRPVVDGRVPTHSAESLMEPAMAQHARPIPPVSCGALPQVALPRVPDRRLSTPEPQLEGYGLRRPQIPALDRGTTYLRWLEDFRTQHVHTVAGAHMLFRQLR